MAGVQHPMLVFAFIIVSRKNTKDSCFVLVIID